MAPQIDFPHKYEPSLEIRKLPTSVVGELAKILDDADLWKRLMKKIPKQLSSTSYRSDITAVNVPKYNSDDFKIIEKGSEQYNKSCTQILFEEWGTSAKIRPSLGHLKYLLIKAELIRAADYVAKLLGEDPAPRPNEGPAAPIVLSLSDLKLQNDANIEEIVHHLDEINYPQAAIEIIRKNSLEIKSRGTPVIPAIVVSEEKPVPASFQVPLVTPQSNEQNVTEVSDMIKFSSTIDAALSKEHQFPSAEIEYQSDNRPAISELLLASADSKNDDSNVQPSSVSESANTESELAAVVMALNQNSSSNQSSILEDDNQMTSQSEADIIPAFVANFGRDSSSFSASDVPLTIPQPNSLNASSTRPSPLPSLSLNTPLPHFTYAELEKATNGFNSDKQAGRFLGQGAFGAVFLAVGLMDKPVAVKKIFLENVDEVDEDDPVSKQFRNEVEVLHKYKHDNLASLLGYSCDGCTYCLVYEYIPGGSLYDALQNHPKNLSWKQRLHIALGTARGVAYLHTASTPLIHRDIKSANILLDAENNPKLCDFGIVKLLPTELTNADTSLCGTSAYMSPEYHRGEISVKLDTFSYGVVLYELLTSLPPLDYNRDYADLVTYVEEHCEGSIETILDKSVGSWSEGDNNFGDELYALALDCLEEVEKRPVMEEVARRLEQMAERLSDS